VAGLGSENVILVAAANAAGAELEAALAARPKSGDEPKIRELLARY
jgi:hypothetical protein